MRIAMVTAGGAGMYCGSCMHDNTLAAALLADGHDVLLIPTYTPIRTDEPDVSQQQVFLGGVNVYLHQKLALWRHVPGLLRRWMDATWLLRGLGALSLKTEASQLGELTLSVLRGEEGRQSEEMGRLAGFVAEAIDPDIVLLSNALLVGAVAPLRRRCKAPVLCLLQGDDVFLEALPESFRSEALELLRSRVRQIDGFLVHSRYYGEFMAEYLGIGTERIHQVPLGVNQAGFRSVRRGEAGSESGATARAGAVAAEQEASEFQAVALAEGGGRFTVGYFARICPEKGLHVLVEAFGLLKQRVPECRLRVGGYLGASQRGYFREAQAAARRSGFELEYAGVLDREGKIRFFENLDVLSVPTVYREPKGLYVLEALASGVPVVQPAHGAFPELLERTGGGLLVEPNDPRGLADALERLYREPHTRRALSAAGLDAVCEHYGIAVMVEATLAVLESYVRRRAMREVSGAEAEARHEATGRNADAIAHGAKEGE